MSLERKDVRFKMDPDAHAALSVLADTAGVDIGEFVENVVEREVIRRVHEARVVADRTARLGIAGSSRDGAGKTGRALD